jgi:hypothetical protein
MWFKASAVVLALMGLGAALRAAQLWWKAGNVPILPETAASISDVPEQFTMALQAGSFESAKLNQRAAKCTAAAAVLSALGSFCGVL